MDEKNNPGLEGDPREEEFGYSSQATRDSGERQDGPSRGCSVALKS